tara:strand:+ start:30887 stop:31321 length:435 start_codon:yes stop_codon:yes gene_type:complete
MNEIPETTKERLRYLTFGRENDSPMFAWTYNEGRCWAAILSIDLDTHETTLDPSMSQASLPSSHHTKSGVVAWACLTFEVDDLPVVGVYCDPDHRGHQYGRTAAVYLLSRLHLPQQTPIYAVSELYPSWPEVLEQAGLVHFEWE